MNYGFTWSCQQHGDGLSSMRDVPGGYTLNRAEFLENAGWPHVPASFDPPALATRIFQDLESMYGTLCGFEDRPAVCLNEEQQAWLRTLISLASALAAYPESVRSLLLPRAFTSDDGDYFDGLDENAVRQGLLLTTGAYQSGYAMTDLLGIIVDSEKSCGFLSADRNTSGVLIPKGGLAKSSLNAAGSVTEEAIRVLVRCRWNRDSLVGHPAKTRPANSRFSPNIHARVEGGVSLAGILGGSVDSIRLEASPGPLEQGPVLFGPGTDAVNVILWDVFLACGYAICEDGLGLLEDRDEISSLVNPDSGRLDLSGVDLCALPVRDALDTLMALRDCLAFLAYDDADGFPTA